MFKTDNSLHVFVQRDAGSGAAIETSSIGEATAGDLIIANATTGAIEKGATGNYTDAIAAGTLVKIGQKDSDGSYRWSPVFNYDDIIKVEAALDASRAEQVTGFGYTGAAGSIEAINSNRYTVRVNFTNNVDLFSKQSDLHFFEYVSDASATEVEIVDNLVQKMSAIEKFNGKTSGKKRASALVQRYSSGTSAALGGSPATISFYSGSDYALASATNHGLVAGEYVKVGHATNTNVPLYKVESVDGANIYLDQPYQGADAATQTCGQMTAAQAAAGSWGITITGIEQEWKLGLFKDAQITFDVTIDGFGSTTAVATSTAPDPGEGHGRQIAEMEWFSIGSAGAPYRHGVMPNNGDDVALFADASLYYNTLFIDVKLSDPKYAVSGSGVGRAQIVLAAKTGNGNEDVTDLFGGAANTITDWD